jgi:hypothetical protein
LTGERARRWQAGDQINGGLVGELGGGDRTGSQLRRSNGTSG